MQMPPNYGADYARRFAALFEAVGQGTQLSRWCRSWLHGIADADSTALFQPDRIHPGAPEGASAHARQCST